jgi:hypothetical protein
VRVRGVAAARGVAASVVACAMLAGCWLTQSFSGLGKASGDAGTGDATATRDSGPPPDGGGESGPGNLLENPGFSGSDPGCGLYWMANLGTIQRSSISKTGTYSCELCPNSTAPGSVFELLSTSPPANGPAGTTYQAGAYFMFADDAGPGNSPPTGQLQLEYMYEAGSPLYTGDSLAVVTNQWQSATTSLTTDAGNEAVQFVMLFAYPQTDAGGTGGCVLIDGVSLIASQ